MELKLEVKTIISPRVEQTISSENFSPLFRETMQTRRHTVLVADSDLPFYLGLADDEIVQIGMEDDEGFPLVLLESSDEPIIGRVERVYQDYCAAARIKSLDDFDLVRTHSVHGVQQSHGVT